MSFVARLIQVWHVSTVGHKISLKMLLPWYFELSARVVEPGTHQSAAKMSVGKAARAGSRKDHSLNKTNWVNLNIANLPHLTFVKTQPEAV